MKPILLWIYVGPNEGTRNSASSSTTDELKKPKSVIKNILSRRAVWLVPVILSIVCIIIGVSVVVYYMWANDKNNNGKDILNVIKEPFTYDVQIMHVLSKWLSEKFKMH